MRLIVLALVLCAGASAAVPTIRGIDTHCTLGNGAVVPACSYGTQVVYTVDTQSYVQVYYDTTCHDSLEAYRWRTKTGYMTAVSLSLHALVASTSYCIQVTARPFAENAIGICSDASCGAPQVTFTTDSALPADPTPPKPYNPTPPDTSLYTVVPMSQSDGECRASADVRNPGQWTAHVWTGDNFQTIIDKIYFGTIIRMTADCTNVGGDLGVYGVALRYKTPDGYGDNDPRHRWIIIEGAVDPAKVPPFGSRFTPDYAGEYKVQTSPAPRPSDGRSQFYDYTDSSSVGPLGAHHYWLRTHTLALNPASSCPSIWSAFARLDGLYASTNLKYIVLDRMYFKGRAYPCEQTYGVTLGGNYIAMIGCYMDNVMRTGAPAIGIQFPSPIPATGGPYNIDNNFIQAVGATVINDFQGSSPSSHDDMTFTRNTITFGKNQLPALGGKSGYTRNPWEMKRGHRGLVKGNWATYWFTTQSVGGAFFLSARGSEQQVTSGITDYRIESNMMSHGKAGIECDNGNQDVSAGLTAEPQPLARITLRNNLMWDLTDTYCPAGICGAPSSAAFMLRPGCQDVKISNNTARTARSWFLPGLFALGASYAVSNYLYVHDNVFWLDWGGGPGGVGGIWGAWDGNGITAFAPRPAPSFAQRAPSPPFDANLTGAVLKLGATVNTGADWGGNIVIGGEYQATAGGDYGPLSQLQLDTFTINWPRGDYFPPGPDQAARESRIGMNPSTYVCSGCGNKGADISLLLRDMGRVTGINNRPAVTSSTATLTYAAPDSRACQARYSSNKGVTWSAWVTDGGGDSARSNTLGGLASSTAYLADILCYYAQVNDGNFYTDYVTSEITRLSFATASSSSVPLSVNNVIAPAALAVGQTASMTMTLNNTNSAALTGLSLSSLLPPGLVPSNPGGTCGGASIVDQRLSAGNLTLAAPPGISQCTITATLTAVQAGTWTSKADLTGGPGGLTTASSNSATVRVYELPRASVEFSPSDIPLAATSTLTIRVQNPNASPMTGVSFTNIMPNALAVATPSDIQSLNCGSPAAGASGTGVVSITGGSIAPNGECVVSLAVTGTSEGAIVNTTSAVLGAVDGFNGTGVAATATLRVGAGDVPLLIRYAANLSAGDSQVNMTNTATFASLPGNSSLAGSICANVYTYSDEQLSSCCSCLISPNALTSLSVNDDLASNGFTASRPDGMIIKLLGSTPLPGGTCNPATVTRFGPDNFLMPGLEAWGSTLQLLPTLAINAATYGLTETSFSKSRLSDPELTRMTQLCALIRANGSGYGLCKSCRIGGLGAAAR